MLIIVCVIGCAAAGEENIEPTAPAAIPMGVILNAPLARFMAPPPSFFRNPPAIFAILPPLKIAIGFAFCPNIDAIFAVSPNILWDSAVGTGSVFKNPVVTSVSVVPTCLSRFWNTGPNLEYGTTSSGSPPSAINALVGEVTEPPSFIPVTSLAIRAASNPADIAVPGPGIVDAIPDPASMRAPVISPFINLWKPNPSPATRPTTGIFFSPTLTAVLAASFPATLAPAFCSVFFVAVLTNFCATFFLADFGIILLTRLAP